MPVMKRSLSLLALLLAPTLGATDAAQMDEPLVPKRRGFHLELLPKSFSPSPQIEMTVYSERTEHGRGFPEATPDRPVYYVAHSQGFQPRGETPAGEHPPLPDQIGTLLHKTLARRGFLPAREREHPPTLALFYYWGSHSAVDRELMMLIPDLWHRERQNIVERAMLVGGHAYARRIARLLDEGMPFYERTGKNDHLLYQAEHDLYYVVVSAYEYAPLAHGERRLVWRTTLTVNAQGVSMQETLPPLITSATRFFGRDTGEAVALERRIHRGSVELGPLVIIESDVPAPTDTKGK